MLKIPATFALLTLFAGASSAAGPFEGYWKETDVDDPVYQSYLKVEADSGYYCVLDGKSSFRFKIRGDSITTPMNGLDAIVLTTSTTLRISGEEKGEEYRNDFARMASSGYPKYCVDEEAEWYGPTALVRKPESAGVSSPRPGNSGPGLLNFRGRVLDYLGRSRLQP
jgi:hypothetical protein